MNNYPNQNNGQFDQELAQKLYERLQNEPDLSNSLYGLFYQIFEKQPGEKFTRYAKREFKEKGDEKLQEKQLPKTSEEAKVKDVPKTEDQKEAPKPEAQKKKKSLQLSKIWELPSEKNVEKKEVFVLDNHRKVIEKFKEMFSNIKPNPKLQVFKDVPILDLNKKPFIEEPEFFKPRKSSFNKIN